MRLSVPISTKLRRVIVKMRNLSNSALRGACVTKQTRAMRYRIAAIRLAREKQVNVRVIPSTAIAESVELAHEFSNRVLRRVGREFPRVGMSASAHISRCYSAGS